MYFQLIQAVKVLYKPTTVLHHLNEHTEYEVIVNVIL